MTSDVVVAVAFGVAINLILFRGFVNSLTELVAILAQPFENLFFDLVCRRLADAANAREAGTSSQVLEFADRTDAGVFELL